MDYGESNYINSIDMFVTFYGTRTNTDELDLNVH